MENKKTILFKPLDCDNLFIKIFNPQIELTFTRTYQIHSDSIEDFKDVVRHSPNRKYFEGNSFKKDLEEGIEIDNKLVEIKEFHVPYKTLLTAENVKDIIPEVVDMVVYKENKLTWDDFINDIQIRAWHDLNYFKEHVEKYYNPPTKK